MDIRYEQGFCESTKELTGKQPTQPVQLGVPLSPPRKTGSLWTEPAYPGGRPMVNNVMPRRDMSPDAASRPATVRCRRAKAWPYDPKPISERSDWLILGGPETATDTSRRNAAAHSKGLLFQFSKTNSETKPKWDHRFPWRNIDDSSQNQVLKKKANIKHQARHDGGTDWESANLPPRPRTASIERHSPSGKSTTRAQSSKPVMSNQDMHQLEASYKESSLSDIEARPQTTASQRHHRKDFPQMQIHSPIRKARSFRLANKQDGCMSSSHGVPVENGASLFSNIPRPPAEPSQRQIKTAVLHASSQRHPTNSPRFFHHFSETEKDLRSVLAESSTEQVRLSSAQTWTQADGEEPIQLSGPSKRAPHQAWQHRPDHDSDLIAKESNTKLPNLYPDNELPPGVFKPAVSKFSKKRSSSRKLTLTGKSRIMFSGIYSSEDPALGRQRREQTKRYMRRQLEKQAKLEAKMQLHKEHQSCMKIQRTWRGHATRITVWPWMDMRVSASIVMQSAWRAFLARQFCLPLLQERAYLRSLFKGALSLQRVVRGFFGRRMARVALQKILMTENENESVCISVISQVIKRKEINWPGQCRAARAELVKRRKIQLQRHNAATLIQTLGRQRKAQRKVSRMRREKAAAETFQTLWRTYLAAKREEKAAKTLQNVWYAHATRRCLLQILSQLELEEYAAILFQSKWRQYTSKSTLAQLQQERREQVAAVLLQCKWRQHTAQSTLAQLRQERREQVAAVLLQCKWRQHIAQSTLAQLRHERREQVAAVLLQCMWRQHTAQSTLAKLRQERREQVAAVLLQCMWRQHTAQSTLAQLRQERREQVAAVLLQCKWRQHTSHSTLAWLQQERREEIAAVLLQSKWRQCTAQSTLAQLWQEQKDREVAAVLLQCKWRQRTAQSTLAQLRQERREEVAAVLLQCKWRQHTAQSTLAQLRQERREQVAAVLLQCKWRQHTAQSTLAQLRQERREEVAAVLLQCMWRQHTAQSTLAQLRQERREEVAAVLLQCKWRQHTAQSTLAQLRQERREQVAAVLLQCMWRQHTAQSTLAKLRQERREQVAAVLLQCKWRQHTAHSTLARLQQDRREEIAAVLLQSKWRQRTAQSTLAQLRQEQKDREFAVLHLQCAYRCYNARVKMVHIRRNHKEMSDAAVLIQSMIRKQMAKKHAHELKSKRDVLSRQRAAALSIQCWWRCCLVQRQMRIRQVECSHHEAALTLQCALRRYAAYQQAVQRRNGTVKIQSWYRGSKSRAKTRRYLEENRRIRQEVSRVEAATKIQRFYRGQQRPLSNLAEDDSKEFNHISYGDALTELPSLLSEMNATSGHTRVASYAPTEVLAPSQCYIQTGAPTEVAPTARGTPSIQDNTSGDLFLGQDRNTLKSLHAVISDQEEASQLENASVCSGTFSSTTWNSAEEEKSNGKATPFTQNTWSSRVSNLSLAESFAPLMAKGGNLAGFMAPAAADVSRLYSEEVAPIRKALAQERERTVELQRKVLFLEAALASQTAQGPNTAYSASTHQNLALELRRASAELARMNSGPDNGRPQSTAEENKGH